MSDAFRFVRLTGILLLFIVMVCPLYAQLQKADTIARDSLPPHLLTLRGHVAGGDDREILPGAYVYLGKKRVALTSTNQKGEFVITGLTPGEIQLSVSYTGYQLFSGSYHLKTDLDVGEIRLQPTVLEEVIVSATPPLAVQRGDTTQFNTAALKVALDADLEDLLKRLPGFEIVDGKIMAQGKQVTKLYIDGMEYSFNDPAAALKNLPARLVNKIKMYDDRSDEAKFSGYDDGRKFRSLNIETHDPGRKKIFGQGSAGFGITDPLSNTFRENNYTALFSANLFAPKQKVTLSGNIQNTGQSGDLPGSRYQGKGGNNNFQTLYANVSSKWGEKLMFSGNYQVSRQNTYSASLSKQEYFPTERYANRIYDNESHSWGDGGNQSVNIRTEYRINEKNRIIFSPTLSFGKNNSRSLNMGGNIENNDTLNSSNMVDQNKGTNIRTGGDFLWLHALQKKGRTWTVRLNGNYDRNLSDQYQNNQERSLDSANNYIHTLRNLLIMNYRTGYSWSASFTWSEPLTERARLGFNYSFRENGDNSQKNSLSFKDEDFQELIGIDTAQTNELKNLYTVHNYGINYNYHAEKLNLNGGLSVSHTRMENRYEYPGKTDSLMKSLYMDLSPRVNLGITTTKNSNLDFSYNGSSSSPNAVQLQDVLDVTNPLQVSKGNPGLKKSYNHSLSLNYSQAVPEKSVFFYSSFTGGQTFNQISSNVKFIQRDTVINDYNLIRGARLTTPVNLNGMWNMGANLNGSFPWKKLKLRFNASLSYEFSHNPSIYDDLKNITDSHSGRLGMNVNTEISENFDCFVSTNSSYSYSRNSTTGGAQYFNEDISSSARWIFWKGFFVNGGYNGRFYINKKGETVNQTKHILNVGAGKKIGKNRQLEISLTANDILQERNSVNYSLSDLYAETSYNTISSSCYMLSLSYRFNNMDKKAANESGHRTNEALAPVHR